MPHANPAQHLKMIGASVGDNIVFSSGHRAMLTYIGKDYAHFELVNGRPYTACRDDNITDSTIDRKFKYDAESLAGYVYIRRNGKPIGHFAPASPENASDMNKMILGGLDRLNKSE